MLWSLRKLIVFVFVLLLAIEGGGEIYHWLKYKQAGKSESSVADPAFDRDAKGSVIYKNIEYSVKKSPQTYRIIVLGGSAAEGFGQNPQDSWWYLLQKRLQEINPQGDKQFEIINMARGSNTSIDDYINFLKEGLVLNPDMVIIYNGWNDIQAFAGNPGWMLHNTESRLSELGKDLSKHDYRVWLKQNVFIAKKYFQIKEDFEGFISWCYAAILAIRNAISHYLANGHHLPIDKFSTFLQTRGSEKKLLQSMTFEDVLKNQEIGSSFLNTFPAFKKEIGELYRHYFQANLDLLAEVLIENKIQPVFIFQPDLVFSATGRALTEVEMERARRLMGDYTDAWVKIIEAYYPLGISIMRETASKHNAVFMDMNQFLLGEAHSVIYHDNVHYTKEGNQIIADKVFTYLTTQKIFSVSAHAV